MSKFNTLKISASAALLALSLGFALPALAEDAADAPPATEQAAPPADDTGTDATAPAAGDDGATDAAPAADGDNSGTQEMKDPQSPAAPEKSAAAPANAPKASDLALNMPVIASDGKEVGKISRISAAADGSIEQIYVNTGAASVVVPGANITEGGETVKLSLTADDVAKLSPADTGDGNG